MSHDFRSARYLDDPFKPVLGLSIPQALALGVAIGLATVTWNLLGARLGNAAITSPLAGSNTTAPIGASPRAAASCAMSSAMRMVGRS